MSSSSVIFYFVRHDIFVHRICFVFELPPRPSNIARLTAKACKHDSTSPPAPPRPAPPFLLLLLQHSLNIFASRSPPLCSHVPSFLFLTDTIHPVIPTVAAPPRPANRQRSTTSRRATTPTAKTRTTCASLSPRRSSPTGP